MKGLARQFVVAVDQHRIGANGGHGHDLPVIGVKFHADFDLLSAERAFRQLLHLFGIANAVAFFGADVEVEFVAGSVAFESFFHAQNQVAFAVQVVERLVARAGVDDLARVVAQGVVDGRYFVPGDVHLCFKNVKFMSSHHIVRDAQEPALLIANGAECGPELLGQLLEWSPFVVVLDRAILRVLDLGIKVDVLLGDFDRSDGKALDLNDIRARQYPIEIIHAPDQNKTDFEKGIDLLIDRGFPAVNIVWATGRRADHTITNLTNLVRYKNQIKAVIFDDHSTVFPLVGRFEKWYPAHTPISLIPVGVVGGIVTSGLSYNLHDETLTMGHRSGNSNSAVQDGRVSIEARTGDLLIMECRD
jgi:thiamine pyrophosphokinase